MGAKIYAALLFAFCFISSHAQTTARPRVNAGPDVTIRVGKTAYLKGTASGVTGVYWKTTGDGTLSSTTSLRTYYKPGPNDIAAGKIAVVLYSRNYPKARDTALVRVLPCPKVAFPIERDTICGSDFGGAYEITASASHSPYNITWSTTGGGSFEYEDTLANSYVYSPIDVGTGGVWIRITLTDPLGGCKPVSDSLFLLILDPARIDLPEEETLVCVQDSVVINGGISGVATTVHWSTSGTGRFSTTNAPVTVYYPSVADKLAGSVVITGVTNNPAGPCGAASDYTTVEFAPYALMRPADTVICAAPKGGSLPVRATLSQNTALYWSSNGFGSFDYEYDTVTNYNYTASDVGLGYIELYCHVYNITTNCAEYVDTIRVWLQEAPRLEFPQPEVKVCSSNPVAPADVYLYGYITGGKWTTSGTGSFANPYKSSTTYKASAADLKAGAVKLHFTTTNPKGPCGSVRGAMTVYFVDCLKEPLRTAPVTKAIDEEDEAISIYPNPADDVIQIQAKNIRNGNTVRITDAQGNVVTTARRISRNRLDVSRLRAGVYFIYMSDGDRRDVVKFVKR